MRKNIAMAAIVSAAALGSLGLVSGGSVSASGTHRPYQVCSSEHGTSGQYGPWILDGVSSTPSCTGTVTYRTILGQVDGDCALIPAAHYTSIVC